MAHERAAKNAFFRTSPHSPISAAGRAGFDGLAYYPVDPAWRFERLRLQPPDDDTLDRIEIATSDGGARIVRRLGTLSFVVGGQPRQLAAYELGHSDGSLFVPFLDATSGAETYRAGRYLDVEPSRPASLDWRGMTSRGSARSRAMPSTPPGAPETRTDSGNITTRCTRTRLARTPEHSPRTD